jgi:5-methylcytosine-specific restriction protein A
MAWSGDRRMQELPDNWKRLRERVLRRDGHECQMRFTDGKRCGEYANQVDHIVRGNNHELANLQALCDYCHKHKTGQEGGAASAASRVNAAGRFRRTERHPGLVGGD